MRSRSMPAALAAITALIVLATACGDVPTVRRDDSEPATPEIQGVPSAFDPETDSDLIAEPLFNAELRLTPGGPLRVRATLVVKPTQEARNTNILIAVPEFALAKSSSDFRRNAMGTPVDGFRFRASLIPDGQDSWRRTVEFQAPGPGYYRVWASVKDTTVLIAQPRGFLQTVEHVEQWFWIDEAGVRMTNGYDLNELPDTVVKREGPRVIHVRGSRSAPSGAMLRPVVRPALWNGPSESTTTSRYASTLTQWPSANARLVWFDQDASVLRPIATEGRVDVWDNYESRYIYTFGVATNIDGTFEMGCPPSEYERWDYTFYAPWNAGFAMWRNTLDARNVITFWGVETYTCVGGDYGANGQIMEVHTNVATLIPASNGFFSHTRPSVTVRIDNNVDNSFYSSGSDQITIKGNASPSHIWGPWGVFVATHEWGHALHEKGLGGNVASGSCPSPHYLNGAYNLQCAYSEGFANFVAAAVMGSATGLLSHFENNSSYPGGDGAVVEGPVASMLLDLTDSSLEPFDNAAFPGSYIGDIVKTCNVRTGVFWQRANGIDHLIHCFEQQVDPAITGNATYFTTRSTDPNTQSNSATTPSDWSVSVVRAIWRKNLYNEN